eukprot:6181940-Pleurochrysis_carterae.AAC.2
MSSEAVREGVREGGGSTLASVYSTLPSSEGAGRLSWREGAERQRVCLPMSARCSARHWYEPTVPFFW